jgi:hypothetical protein
VLPGDEQASLSWSLPLGADRAYVEQRDLDASDPGWHRSAQPVVLPQLGAELDGLVDGDRYRWRVRAAKGTAVAEDLTSATVRARPGVPLAVPALRLTPRHRGLRATWDTATLATSYLVSWWPAGHHAASRSTSTTRLARTVLGLVPWRRYVVSVRGLRGSFQGPARRTDVVPAP